MTNDTIGAQTPLDIRVSFIATGEPARELEAYRRTGTRAMPVATAVQVLMRSALDYWRRYGHLPGDEPAVSQDRGEGGT